MTDPNLTVSFAHTIEPDSLEYLAELVSSVEWEKSKNLIYTLSKIKHPLGGGATYYVLFLDPSKKDLQHVIHADLLYLIYDTKYYNEEILLITPK